MTFGFETWITDYSLDAATLAREVEAAGFDSLWIPEHTHVPLESHSTHPGRAPATPDHAHALDIFVAATLAATATSTLKIGTGICIAPQHDPIHLARGAASVDWISGGRFLLGVGAGWNEAELANHGVDPAKKFGVLEEQMQAIKAIWTSDVAEFHGRHVRFSPLQSWPKPVQDPHLPILVGGMGPKVIERIVAYGDGWIMMPFEGEYSDGVLARIEEFRDRCEVAGRGRLPVCAITLSILPPAEMERLESAGVDRLIFLIRSPTDANVTGPNGATADFQRAALDRCAAVVASWGR